MITILNIARSFAAGFLLLLYFEIATAVALITLRSGNINVDIEAALEIRVDQERLDIPRMQS